MIAYLHPKVIVTRKHDGSIRGSCRGCGTVAAIADEVCVAGFKRRHDLCADIKS